MTNKENAKEEPRLEPKEFGHLKKNVQDEALAIFVWEICPYTSIVCKLCDCVIKKSTNKVDYDLFLSVEEQEHMASDTHRANWILWQLSGRPAL